MKKLKLDRLLVINKIHTMSPKSELYKVMKINIGIADRIKFLIRVGDLLGYESAEVKKIMESIPAEYTSRVIKSSTSTIFEMIKN